MEMEMEMNIIKIINENNKIILHLSYKLNIFYK